MVSIAQDARLDVVRLDRFLAALAQHSCLSRALREPRSGDARAHADKHLHSNTANLSQIGIFTLSKVPHE